MDTRIIADDDRLAGRVWEILQSLAIDCPPMCFIGTDTSACQIQALDEFEGLVLLVVNKMSSDHFELLQQLRSTVRDSATIIVVSCIDNHETILNAIRSGANDFIVDNDRLSDELASSVTRLKTQRRHREINGRVVSILPCHSARDASFVAANLAAAVAKKSRSCGLLDYQMRYGDLTTLLKVTPRHTIVDLLKQQGTIDQAILEQALTQHESGIRLLAGPSDCIDMRHVRPQICHQIIALAQRLHDFVFVNLEDLQHAEQLQATADSDDIVLTMRPDVVSLRRAKQYLELILQRQIPRDRLQVLVLGTGHSTELPVGSISKVLDAANIQYIPDDPVLMLRSINVGNPLVDESPKAKISQAIVSFAERLIGKREVVLPPSTPRKPSKVKSALSAVMSTLAVAK